MKEKKDLKCGHRQRLRQKFIISQESINDYELLEMVLFASNVRKDTKTLAKQLIEHFGSLIGVFEANINELEIFNNMGISNAVSIKCIKEIINRFLKGRIVKKSITLQNIQDIERYCVSTIGCENVEKLKVLFLNSKYELKKEEYFGSGDAQEVKLYKNILVSKAVQYSCYNIILVHNHPSGDPTPSVADLKFTNQVYKTSKIIGIPLLDHIIIGNNKYYSFYDNGDLHE